MRACLALFLICAITFVCARVGRALHSIFHQRYLDRSGHPISPVPWLAVVMAGVSWIGYAPQSDVLLQGIAVAVLRAVDRLAALMVVIAGLGSSGLH